MPVETTLACWQTGVSSAEHLTPVDDTSTFFLGTRSVTDDPVDGPDLLEAGETLIAAAWALLVSVESKVGLVVVNFKGPELTLSESSAIFLPVPSALVVNIPLRSDEVKTYLRKTKKSIAIYLNARLFPWLEL